MKPIVQVAEVSKRFAKVEAVSRVSFELLGGETVALVGHNGAGKTTLMKLIIGLIRPSEGRLRLLGEDPAAGEFAARRRLGYLPENVSFNAALSGRETLAFYARLKRENPGSVDALLERVGLGHAADRRVGTYSKGMRQRLGLAQALLGEPKVLLLDEPTTGLDPALRQSFYEIIEELRSGGSAVLLSSHALTELEERAGRVIIMNRGLKVADGSLQELREIARLPTRVRVRARDNGMTEVAAWFGERDCRCINGHTLEISTSHDGKIDLLRRATSVGSPIIDVDVIPPTLDDLYSHFLRSQERVPCTTS